MPSARRHRKSHNKYHFQTFSERLANVNIDVIHRIDRVGIQPEDVETYFSEGVQKWREMHCTEHYDIFLNEVSGLVQTFPQLVHHQDTIVQSLQNHLLVPSSTALEPLLDLVVQLARDLQKDFYPHFGRFFSIITGLLNAQDTEQLEWVFTCLSYLYKFLWRLLVQDIRSVYSMYSPLLEHKKEHIRNFAAESFSFLMRKVPDHESLFDWMFLDLVLNPAKAEGVGQLLFQMCRGVQQHFHSCTERVLRIMLSKLGPATQSGPELPWASVFEALQQMLHSMACYTTRENCVVIWDMLVALVWHVWEAMLESQDVDNPTYRTFTEELERSLQLVLKLSLCKRGLLVTKPEQLQQMCLLLVQDNKLPETCQVNVLQIVAALLLGDASGLRLELATEMVKAVFESPCTLDALLNFSQELFPWASYQEMFLPYLLPRIQQGLLAGQADSSRVTLIFLAELILNKVTSVISGSSEFQTYPLTFQNLPTRATKGVHARAKRPVSVAAHLLGVFEPFCKPKKASRPNADDLGDLFTTLVVLPHVRPFEDDLFAKAVYDVFNWIFVSVVDKKESSDKLLFVLQQATCCLLHLDSGPQVLQVLTAERLFTLLRLHSSVPCVLLLVDLVFTRMAMLGECQAPASSNLLEWFPFLQPNLSSDNSQVRFLTLRILNHFHVELPLVE
uniref:small subunit processome component 20 homolog n=1 Tax=Myxine glutinosa TaxID=7769 RepID=UPI00359014F6